MPDLEYTGKRPVWLVQIKWGSRMILVYISLTGGSGTNYIFTARAVIDLMPYLCLCRWPRMVGTSNGKYFDINSFVKPGKVAKFPLLIALIHVLFTG